MAIQCVAVDKHLTSSTANNFTISTSPCSIVCWINASWAAGSIGSFVGLYGPSPTPVTAIQIGRRGVTSGVVSCWTWGAGVLVQSGPGAAVDNEWTHVGYTYNGSTHTLYVNGALAATAGTSPILGQFTMVYINGYPTSPTGEVGTHQLDNYAYYNRELAADEIKTIYAAHGARHNIVHGLIAAYRFDEDAQDAAVTVIKDRSGNGNDLVVVGAGASPIIHTYSTVVCSNLTRVQ